MAVTIQMFLNKVAVIKALNPARREPGDGSNGYCDCIGLIIGAIRRCGLKWTGIHGSNWAARKEAVNLIKDFISKDIISKNDYDKNLKKLTEDLTKLAEKKNENE